MPPDILATLTISSAENCTGTVSCCTGVAGIVPTKGKPKSVAGPGACFLAESTGSFEDSIFLKNELSPMTRSPFENSEVSKTAKTVVPRTGIEPVYPKGVEF